MNQKVASVAERLQHALQLRGMRQRDLAEKSGVHKGTINNHVRGCYVPKNNCLAIYAQELGGG